MKSSNLNDFGWCMECRKSMWIADAFEDPEEVYCTKKKNRD